MRVLQWGIIGCGDIVRRRIAPALNGLDQCAIAGVARRDAAQLEACRAELSSGQGFRNWRDLVAADDVEAVYIATPVSRHAEQAIAALAAGKHVLCEKPLAMDLAECDRVLAAAERSSGFLGVAYYRHYYPAVTRMQAIIASGEIGDVILARFDAAETFRPAADHSRRWILERRRAGGGSLMDFGCHRIEVLLNLLGPARSATGTTGRVYPDHDVEDTATVAMAFAGGASGLVTVIRGGTEDYDTVSIQGTQGSIRLETLNEGGLTVSTAAGTRRENWPCHANPHLPLIEAFSRDVCLGQSPAVNGRVGRAVQAVIEAVYTASLRAAGRAGGFNY
jgi:predicted dehydrogenase